MNNKFSLISVLLLSSVTLTACASVREWSGMDDRTPDEFRVLSKAPLVMPPDYKLRPPRAGTPTAQNLSPSSQAINALFPGRTKLPPAPSAGEDAVLDKLGTRSISGNIRSVVSGDDTVVVEKGDLLDDVLTSGEVSNSPDGSHILKGADDNS